jgi:hypothetical protein
MDMEIIDELIITSISWGFPSSIRKPIKWNISMSLDKKLRSKWISPFLTEK